MIRRTSLLLLLLIMWIVQGCTSSQHPAPTPYRKIPELRQVEALPDMQDTMKRSATLPESSIVKGISDQANELIRNGELDAAAQTIERGLRIAPKEAFLWSQLATVRLRQHRYNQAQSLAAKSSSLAPENSALISKNKKIIEFAGK
jgi:Flp pilus assembly protein TadD